MNELKTYTTEAIVQGHTPHIGPMKEWVSLDDHKAKMQELRGLTSAFCARAKHASYCGMKHHTDACTCALTSVLNQYEQWLTLNPETP